MSAAVDLADFGGTARLFPLPGFVFFPHVTKLFHIFEPRYRRLAADAIAGDKFIAVVQLAEGWERDYEGAPRVEPMGCLAKIEQVTPFADGRSNLLLRGVCRVALEKELLTTTPYRQAQVRTLLDSAPKDLPELRTKLCEQALRRLPPHSAAFRVMETLFQSQLAIGGLADVVGYYLPLAPEAKQSLLAELDVEKRVRALLEQLAKPLPMPPPDTPAPEEPPRPRKRIEFSDN